MKARNISEQMRPDLGRRRLSAGLALGAVAPLAWGAALSGKDVNVIVSPFAAAGGTNDVLSRIMADALARILGETFIVENRPGASATIGTAYVARSQPDGHTLLMGNSASHGTNPSIYQHVPYDAVKDFAPVGMVGTVPLVLVVGTALGVRTVAELIDHGRRNPGTLSFGSSGIGSTGHLCGEMFKAATGVDMVHSPYKAEPLAIKDVIGGQLTMAFVGVGPATLGIQTGMVRAIAVAAPQRAAGLPDVPTMKEAGVDGVEVSQWYALFARSGTPQARIETLNQAVVKSLTFQDVRERMQKLGLEPRSSTPEELAAFSQMEIERFGKIIHKLGISRS